MVVSTPKELLVKAKKDALYVAPKNGKVKEPLIVSTPVYLLAKAKKDAVYIAPTSGKAKAPKAAKIDSTWSASYGGIPFRNLEKEKKLRERQLLRESKKRKGLVEEGKGAGEGTQTSPTVGKKSALKPEAPANKPPIQSSSVPKKALNSDAMGFHMLWKLPPKPVKASSPRQATSKPSLHGAMGDNWPDPTSKSHSPPRKPASKVPSLSKAAQPILKESKKSSPHGAIGDHLPKTILKPRPPPYIKVPGSKKSAEKVHKPTRPKALPVTREEQYAQDDAKVVKLEKKLRRVHFEDDEPPVYQAAKEDDGGVPLGLKKPEAHGEGVERWTVSMGMDVKTREALSKEGKLIKWNGEHYWRVEGMMLGWNWGGRWGVGVLMSCKK
jgi:hypothetical protein